MWKTRKEMGKAPLTSIIISLLMMIQSSRRAKQQKLDGSWATRYATFFTKKKLTNNSLRYACRDENNEVKVRHKGTKKGGEMTKSRGVFVYAFSHVIKYQEV